ncbi:hypothetical protein DAPPUDRAFT_270346 [Daphnia pulex]|uniref:Uncharacterized protein n=1 Tax=Daphnia pulex TaxID=6669 RepID=E9I0J8_DAPPU|nr:hypothetical protein DAPPUDRAFT_270346 [Daphnia pulex]|eukprot:EFX62483.1 hypothetical protein DAPPUDRAFT_270346 [Daphnia pulex]
MKSIVACLLVLAVSVHSQWPNNFAGYGLNAAGYFGGFNGLYPGYAGLPAGPFYGHPGRFVNYPAASLPAYDAFGTQVGGYGQVQDTPEVAQAKVAHFAAHDAARARLFAPIVAAPVAVPLADVAVAPTSVVETVAAPAESVAVGTPSIMSRKKRQIHQLMAPVGASPFAYSFTSPLTYNHYAGYSPFAYSNFVNPDGYNYGAPFGFHFAHPSANLVAAAPAVVASPVAASNTDNTAAVVPSVFA